MQWKDKQMNEQRIGVGWSRFFSPCHGRHCCSWLWHTDGPPGSSTSSSPRTVRSCSPQRCRCPARPAYCWWPPHTEERKGKDGISLLGLSFSILTRFKLQCLRGECHKLEFQRNICPEHEWTITILFEIRFLFYQGHHTENNKSNQNTLCRAWTRQHYFGVCLFVSWSNCNQRWPLPLFCI